ncbi:MAG TPA: hypothetical protein PL182_06795 [Pseudobdellovibrionaceae bacterium]|nr:hypothetical protein [Pseudobdellovibrionaceae bacterium]
MKRLFLFAAASLLTQTASAYSALFDCRNHAILNTFITIDLGEGTAVLQSPTAKTVYTLEKVYDFLPTGYIFGKTRECAIKFDISGDRESGVATFACSRAKYPQAPKFQMNCLLRK